MKPEESTKTPLIEIEILRSPPRTIAGMRGLVTRGSRVYALFREEPPAPIRNQLHQIAGSP